jgi:hypothetical protein
MGTSCAKGPFIRVAFVGQWTAAKQPRTSPSSDLRVITVVQIAHAVPRFLGQGHDCNGWVKGTSKFGNKSTVGMLTDNISSDLSRIRNG